MVFTHETYIAIGAIIINPGGKGNKTIKFSGDWLRELIAVNSPQIGLSEVG